MSDMARRDEAKAAAARALEESRRRTARSKLRGELTEAAASLAAAHDTLETLYATNRAAGAPADNASSLLERAKTAIASAEMMKNLLPAAVTAVLWQGGVDEAALMHALADADGEARSQQFIK
jgi:hypothetical protein